MRDIREIEKRYKDRDRMPKRASGFFKKKYLILLILIVAFATNPGEEKHKEAVKAKVNSIVMPVDASGYQAGNAYIDQLVTTHVGSSNYLLFSTTEVTWNDETRTIGFGAFGNVFLSNMVDEALNKKFN